MLVFVNKTGTEVQALAGELKLATGFLKILILLTVAAVESQPFLAVTFTVYWLPAWPQEEDVNKWKMESIVIGVVHVILEVPSPKFQMYVVPGEFNWYWVSLNQNPTGPQPEVPPGPEIPTAGFA